MKLILLPTQLYCVNLATTLAPLAPVHPVLLAQPARPTAISQTTLALAVMAITKVRNCAICAIRFVALASDCRRTARVVSEDCLFLETPVSVTVVSTSAALFVTRAILNARNASEWPHFVWIAMRLS